LYEHYIYAQQKIVEIAEDYAASLQEGQAANFTELRKMQWPFELAMRHCFDDFPFEGFVFNTYLARPFGQAPLPLNQVPHWAHEILKRGDG